MPQIAEKHLSHSEAWLQGRWDHYTGRPYNPGKYDAEEYRTGWLSFRW